MLKSNSISRTLLAFLILSLFLFQSCENDEENNYYWAQDVGVLTPTDLAGIVTDEEGNPLAGVLITSHHLMAMTNQLGFFNIPDTWAIRGRVELKMEKPGYLDGFYAGPTQGEKTIFKLILSQGQTEEFSSESETTIELSENATIHLPNDSYYCPFNYTNYSGTITARLKYIDPRDPNFSYLMPGGDFRGIDESGEEMLLISYGAIGIELTGYDGEELQLADGQTALIELEVPEDMLEDAPSTIPLWHFNEEIAIWEEEGFATLEGSKYIGEVSHFSFWNIDMPVSDRAFVSGYARDCNGVPIHGTGINVGPLIVYTDENGFYESNVAVDLEFDVSFAEFAELAENPIIDVPAIYDGEYIELEDLVLNYCPTYLEGEIHGCDGNLVEAGILTISWAGNSKVIYFSNGTFNVIIPSNTEITLHAISNNFNGEFIYSSPAAEGIHSLDEPLLLCTQQECSSAQILSPMYYGLNIVGGTTEFGTTWIPIGIGFKEFQDFMAGDNFWRETNYVKLTNGDEILTLLHDGQLSGSYDLRDIVLISNADLPVLSEKPNFESPILERQYWINLIQWPTFGDFWFNDGTISLNFSSPTQLEIIFNGKPFYFNNAVQGFSGVAGYDGPFISGSACFDLSE